MLLVQMRSNWLCLSVSQQSLMGLYPLVIARCFLRVLMGSKKNKYSFDVARDSENRLLNQRRAP